MKLNFKQIGLGIIIGAILGSFVSQYGIRHFHRPWDENKRFEHLFNKLDSKLNLTEDQKPRVREAMQKGRAQIKSFRSECKPKYENLRKQTSAEIRSLLNPDQQKKFDELEASWEQKRARFHGGWFH